MTRHRQPVPADRQGPSTPRGLFLCALRRRRSRRPEVGGAGGRTLPRRTGHMDRPGARGADRAAMPGGQARMSGTPSPRRSKRSSPFVLDGLPGTTPACHSRWSVVGRAFGACCFAGKLRSPAPPAGEPRVSGLTPGSLPYGNPYAVPYAYPYGNGYARRVRTPGSGGRGYLSSSVPLRGASQPQKPRLTGPTRGSGADAPSGALRAIDSSARPRSWRTYGPRRLRRQSQPALVAT